jgi:hypothetical protein
MSVKGLNTMFFSSCLTDKSWTNATTDALAAERREGLVVDNWN